MEDLSRFKPELRRLRTEAKKALACGDNRKFADLTLEAVLCSDDDPWTYGRFFLFVEYPDILQKFPSLRNESDIKSLRKILYSSSEPAIFRAMAAHALAFCHPDDREQAVDYLRTVVEIGLQADPCEANRPVIVLTDDHETTRTAGIELEKLVSLAKLNMNVVTNPDFTKQSSEYQLLFVRERKAFGFNPPGQNITVYPIDESYPPEVQRRVGIGGGACDCCRKTLEELGVTRFNFCSVCEMAYYCSEDCLRKQWKAGHKAACRKLGDIRPNDLMQVRGLKVRPELNGKLVTVKGKDPKNGARWWVSLYGKEKDISVAPVNLFRTQPEM